MSTFVALLRGINVGKAKRIPMEVLRALLAELGYSPVATLLNSGNAVFHAAKGASADHAAAISDALARQLQLDVPVIVHSSREFAAVVAENPWPSAPDPSRLLVAFVQDAQALSGLRAIERLLAPSDQFVQGHHAAYLHCAGGILESKAGEALLGKLGKQCTTRNWATVCKLQALLHSTETAV